MDKSLFDSISEPVAQRAASALSRLSVALRNQSWRGATALGLSPTQGQILTLLGEHSGKPMRISAIATALALSQATVSESIGTLVHKGLLIKTQDAQDRRAVVVRLTRDGKQHGAQSALWPDFLVKAIDVLPSEDQTILLGFLIKIIRELQERGEISASRMCISCRHFDPNLYPGQGLPHHCHLVNAPFGLEHLRIDCPEHEAAELIEQKKHWLKFIT